MTQAAPLASTEIAWELTEVEEAAPRHAPRHKGGISPPIMAVVRE